MQPDHVETSSIPPSRKLFGNFFASLKKNGVTRKIAIVLTSLITVNIIIWVVALVIFRIYPGLLASAVLAYTLGLRHAVDADHISAIDNITRRLVQEGQTPVLVGLFFSLGHSTIVICSSIAVAAAIGSIKSQFEDFRSVSSIIGTSVSAAFLLLIAIINIVVLVGIYRVLRRLKRHGTYKEPDIEHHIDAAGILGRLLRPVFRLVDTPWKMYPLGVLFGLGFDTSTEVALLAISAAQSANGAPIWLVLLLPLLFTAGMSLIDTADGILMLGAYGYTRMNPIRKLYYNFVITSLSVAVALVVAFIEVVNIFASVLDLQGSFWEFFLTLGDSFDLIGYVIIATFVLTWAVAALVYRCGGYRQLEEKYNLETVMVDEEKIVEKNTEEGSGSEKGRSDEGGIAEEALVDKNERQQSQQDRIPPLDITSV